VQALGRERSMAAAVQLVETPEEAAAIVLEHAAGPAVPGSPS